MKYRLLLLFLFVSVLLPICAVTSEAQCQLHTLRVRVPFDFIIRDSQFPAGQYTFQQECERVYVRNQRGEMLHVHIALPSGPAAASHESKVIFFNFRGVHVLTGVRWGRSAQGAELAPPGQEIEIASRFLGQKPVLAGAGGRP